MAILNGPSRAADDGYTLRHRPCDHRTSADYGPGAELSIVRLLGGPPH
jgi:hypothetical protein